MKCKNHPETESVALCAGCQEPFCDDCIVELNDQKYCADCKIMAVDGEPVTDQDGTEPCEEANQALLYAIIGIFCFGFILGPIAISKALEAKRQMKVNPRLGGSGKAQTGFILGIVVTVLSVLGLINVIINIANA